MTAFTQAEREYYTLYGITGNNLSQMRREFYIGQLGAGAANKTVDEMELQWLQNYTTANTSNRQELWLLATQIATGYTFPNNTPISEIRYVFYTTQGL